MTSVAEASTGPVITSLGRRVRPAITVGILVVLIFFGGFGYWAAVAPIYGAAIATGTVSPENSRRTIQHLEGGVIKKILVRDGDIVSVGQTLVLLDDTRARASVEQQGLLIDSLQAELERLTHESEYLVERDLHRELVFSDELLQRAETERTLAEILRLQSFHYKSRQAALRASDKLLKQTIHGYGVEIEGLELELESVESQLALLSEEGDILQSLRDRGLEVRQTTADNLLNRSQIEQVRVERQSRISSLVESINQARLQEEDVWAAELEATTSEILSVARDLLDARTTYATYVDTLERTVIKSPIHGTLISFSVNTEGAVVGAGETIVEIVPSDEALTLEARIDPNDIDVIAPGQTAAVVLLAYPRRNLPKIYGTLTSVSADSLVDSSTGESYYLGKIEIEDKEIARLGDDVALVPGMSVEVMIQMAPRTFVDYLFEPLLRYSNRAFREG
ncbi:HlyD family type I secretion periplasmic adaptor subunit [Aliiruegeria sabulilitoris]|uniref:HlyD family type I secretion periplasmic adaptor subunit n=1 Tax=Aliiruegeria sabulilitoris TaxID=1510458 RepID=UPI00082F8B5A|nr:HlyD family type I secretion periplasmic adaptor subunit [Aliiruegeria sabulilitoris]NDR57031.1 HlyD family type I secretion periplasmic adaptor subunit [Pseudoruegeria sp. M32A2M]